MKMGKTLYVFQRNAWRAWLAKWHKKKKEIWLVYYRKDSGIPRISYNDAVEEALCYGWIDSTVKSLGPKRFAQRFSPRKPTSGFSQMNRERVRHLLAEKKMTIAGLRVIAHAFDPAGKEQVFIIAPDVLRVLRADPAVWTNFQNFPKAYQRIRIIYIEHGRRRGPGVFQKRLQYFIKKTAQNKRFGFVKEAAFQARD